jgi:hypothetical protein
MINVHFGVTNQLLIRYYVFVDTVKKRVYNETVYELFIGFEKACDSVR